MRKSKLFIVGLIALMMVGGIIIGCELGCPYGDCIVETDANADGRFDICAQEECATHKVPYPVPANTNVKCSGC